MKIERVHDRGHLWIQLLFAVVMALMLVAIFAGTRIYSAAQSASSNDERVRAVDGFITSTMRSELSSATTAVKDGPEGDMLCLSEATGDGEYETRIYLYMGELCTEYGERAAEVDPDNATAIARCSQFKVDDGDTALVVTTDCGTLSFAKREGVAGR